MSLLTKIYDSVHRIFKKEKSEPALKALEWDKEIYDRQIPYYTGIIRSSNGTLYWLLNGDFHRENGPAIIYPNGGEEYYIHGAHHRIGGPAITITDIEIWIQNGHYHRLDGFAYECRLPTNPYFSIRRREWWYEGKRYSPEFHFELALSKANTDEEKNAILFNLDRWKDLE